MAELKIPEWALRQAARVYNLALIDDVSDREFEDRIAAAIEKAYLKGVERGHRTQEEWLGA